MKNMRAKLMWEKKYIDRKIKRKKVWNRVIGVKGCIVTIKDMKVK